jgi:hypothetical protein
MFRGRRTAAGLIAILTIAALLPGLCDVDGAVVFESIWVLLPDPVPAFADLPVVVATEQLDPLLALLASRAPPFLHA